MCVREEGTVDKFGMWALHDLVGKSRVDTVGGVFLDLYETRSRSNANSTVCPIEQIIAFSSPAFEAGGP
jgi:hypothetical protein